jgi:hypothetical protein
METKLKLAFDDNPESVTPAHVKMSTPTSNISRWGDYTTLENCAIGVSIFLVGIVVLGIIVAFLTTGAVLHSLSGSDVPLGPEIDGIR